MASISFNNLENNNLISDSFTYVDFHLDLEEDKINVYNSRNQKRGRDVKVAYDVNAIRNSLTNIFNTIPGQRRLLPTFGLDLRRYLFDPVSKDRADTISRDIYSNIIQWEPRVRIVNIYVIGVISVQEYNITLELAIPFAKEKFSFQGILNKEGFFFAT
jgi:phage baseplate assembly protein W